MEFGLTTEQRLFQRGIRRFADGVLRPAAALVDEHATLPPEVLKQAEQVGLFGLLVPPAYGGQGLDTVRWTLAIEQVAHACAAMASVLVAHGALACLPLARGGLANLSTMSPLSWLTSLPGTGLMPAASDERDAAVSAPARATKTGDGWHLAGAATNVPNAGLASILLVWAQVDAADGAPDLTAFVLHPAHLEGYVDQAPPPKITLGPTVDRLGLRGAPTADVTLSGGWVPQECRLALTSPAAVLVEAQELFTLGVAAQALGIAQAALDAALAYAGEREQFGRPIGAFQGLRWLLADLHLAVESARLLVYRAAWLRDAGEPIGPAAALAKLAASRAATEAAIKAVQVHGGYGYLRESPVQRYLRDAKGTELASGGNGLQRSRVADSLLPPGP